MRIFFPACGPSTTLGSRETTSSCLVLSPAMPCHGDVFSKICEASPTLEFGLGGREV